MVCQDCHGNVGNVAQTIKDGRRPWLDEPSCGNTECHGAGYSEEANRLYKNSKGHGGLFCSACHGSQHAIVPSGNERDNVQNISLQGYAGILTDCSVCHGYNPADPGPHGMVVSAMTNPLKSSPHTYALQQNYPNPFNPATKIEYSIPKTCRVTLNIYDLLGRKIITLVNEEKSAGTYQIKFDDSNLASGMYLYRLQAGSFNETKRLMLLK
jgi:hypothetical protein